MHLDLQDKHDLLVRLVPNSNCFLSSEHFYRIYLITITPCYSSLIREVKLNSNHFLKMKYIVFLDFELLEANHRALNCTV